MQKVGGWLGAEIFFKGVVQIKPWEMEALGNKINKKIKRSS